MVLRIGNYVLKETLGTGTFGKVKLGEHRLTGHRVAVKILNRAKIKALSMTAKVQREIQVLKLFRHPHIIKLYEVIYTPTDIFMIMEYVSGGELFQYIVRHGKLSEDDARSFFQQIISAVDYCHEHMIVHRDLKPENLLLDEHGNVKVADFGLSNIMKDGEFLETSCGSPNYAAPEVISGQQYAGPEVDIWSCGVILYALICGRLPFDDEYIPNLFKKIKAGDYSVPNFISSEATDLIVSMLQVDPLQRITMAGLKTHPWFVVDLPPYIAVAQTPISVVEVDEGVLQELCRRLHVAPDHARAAILSEGAVAPEDKDIVVAHRLMLDSRAILSAAIDSSEKEIPDILLAKSPPAWDFREDLGTPVEALLTANGTATHPVASALKASDMEIARRFELGTILHRTPKETMRSVMLALAEREFVWKRSGYLLVAQEGEDGSDLKIRVQVYKVETNTCVVDMQRIRGQCFAFLDICSHIFTRLRPLVDQASPRASAAGGAPGGLPVLDVGGTSAGETSGVDGPDDDRQDAGASDDSGSSGSRSLGEAD